MASSSLASNSSFTLISSRALVSSGGGFPRRQSFSIQSSRCCSASQAEPECTSSSVVEGSVGRRQTFVGVAGAAVSAALASVVSSEADAMTAKPVEVGAYLPRYAGDGNFCLFKASTKDTPALRAGNVDPYEFILPTKWKQTRVANILSGNYCQPKCAEPWVEVKFEDDREGTLQVFAAPMVRLTNKPYAKIEEIGSPDKVISALGPFVTGNSYDPEEVIETSVKQRDNQTFYTYELQTPYARTGSHNLASATAKGNVVLLLVVSANEKQWLSSQATLRQIIDSFVV